MPDTPDPVRAAIAVHWQRIAEAQRTTEAERADRPRSVYIEATIAPGSIAARLLDIEERLMRGRSTPPESPPSPSS